MNKFYVGQRVRVVYRPSEKYGEECTVRAIGCTGWGWTCGTFHDGIEVDIPHPEVSWCCFQPCDLEPIDDGRERSEWSALANIWKPSQVRA